MAQVGDLRRQIFRSIDDHMSDAVLPLQETRGLEHSGLTGGAANPLPHPQPDGQLDGAGFIFKRHERDSLSGSRVLS